MEKDCVINIGVMQPLKDCLSKIKNNPKYFVKNTESHQYNTRNKNQLWLSAHKTSKFECSPSYAGALLYNKLPKELIAEEKIQIFKHAQIKKNSLVQSVL